MARLFDNSASDYLEWSLNSDITAVPITIAAWAYHDEATTQALVSLVNESLTGDYFELAVSSDHRTRANAVAGGTSSVAQSSAGSINTWQHHCAVFAANNSRTAYLNGGSSGNNTATRTPSTPLTWSIGRVSASTPLRYWSGHIAEIGVWAVALSTDEISALAGGASPLSIRPASLYMYVPLVRRQSPEFSILVSSAFGVAKPVFTVTGTTVSDHPRIFNARGKRAIPKSSLNTYNLTAAQGSFTLSGQTASLKATRTLTAAQGSFTLSGQTALLKRGYPLTAGTGSFSLTGQAAGLRADRKLTAGVGSFSLSGQAAGLNRGFPLTAGNGSFTLTGVAAGLRVARILTAGAGTFALTGQSAGLYRGYRLTSACGTFSLSGQAATLTKSSAAAYTLTADVGTFSLSGQDANLLRGLKLTASAGSFTLSGIAAGLYVARTLSAGTGAYTLSCQAAGLRITRVLTASAGSFVLTGSSASLLIGRRLTAGQGIFVLSGQSATLVYLLSGEPLIVHPGRARLFSPASHPRAEPLPGRDRSNADDSRPRNYAPGGRIRRFAGTSSGKH